MSSEESFFRAAGRPIDDDDDEPTTPERDDPEQEAFRRARRQSSSRDDDDDGGSVTSRGRSGPDRTFETPEEEAASPAAGSAEAREASRRLEEEMERLENEDLGPDLMGSDDPRFRSDLFDTPHEQQQIIERLEQGIRRGYGEPGIEFRPEDFIYQDKGSGRYSVRPKLEAKEREVAEARAAQEAERSVTDRGRTGPDRTFESAEQEAQSPAAGSRDAREAARRLEQDGDEPTADELEQEAFEQAREESADATPAPEQPEGRAAIAEQTESPATAVEEAAEVRGEFENVFTEAEDIEAAQETGFPGIEVVGGDTPAAEAAREAEAEFLRENPRLTEEDIRFFRTEEGIRGELTEAARAEQRQELREQLAREAGVSSSGILITEADGRLTAVAEPDPEPVSVPGAERVPEVDESFAAKMAPPTAVIEESDPAITADLPGVGETRLEATGALGDIIQATGETVAPHIALVGEGESIEARAEREEELFDRATAGFQSFLEGDTITEEEAGGLLFTGGELFEETSFFLGEQVRETLPLEDVGPQVGEATVGAQVENIVAAVPETIGIVGGAATQFPVTAGADIEQQLEVEVEDGRLTPVDPTPSALAGGDAGFVRGGERLLTHFAKNPVEGAAVITLPNVGKISRGVSGRVRARGTKIPESRLVRESVREGEADFPLFSERVARGGTRESEFPAKTGRTAPEEFRSLSEEFAETGIKTSESEVAGMHATDVDLFGDFTKGGFEMRASPRSFEPEAGFFAPELSPHFLRLSETGETSFLSEIRPRLPRLRAGRPRIVRAKFEGVESMPEGVRTTGQATEFLQSQLGEGRLFTRPEGRLSPEAEAMVAGATKDLPGQEFSLIGQEFYTVIEGQRVPIIEFRAGRGSSGVEGAAGDGVPLSELPTSRAPSPVRPGTRVGPIAGVSTQASEPIFGEDSIVVTEDISSSIFEGRDLQAGVDSIGLGASRPTPPRSTTEISITDPILSTPPPSRIQPSEPTTPPSETAPPGPSIVETPITTISDPTPSETTPSERPPITEPTPPTTPPSETPIVTPPPSTSGPTTEPPSEPPTPPISVPPTSPPGPPSQPPSTPPSPPTTPPGGGPPGPPVIPPVPPSPPIEFPPTPPEPTPPLRPPEFEPVFREFKRERSRLGFEEIQRVAAVGDVPEFVLGIDFDDDEPLGFVGPVTGIEPTGEPLIEFRRKRRRGEDVLTGYDFDIL